MLFLRCHHLKLLTHDIKSGTVAHTHSESRGRRNQQFSTEFGYMRFYQGRETRNSSVKIKSIVPSLATAGMHAVHAEVGGQYARADSILPQYRFWRSKSSLKDLVVESPYSLKPSCQPIS